MMPMHLGPTRCVIKVYCLNEGMEWHEKKQADPNLSCKTQLHRGPCFSFYSQSYAQTVGLLAFRTLLSL